MLTLALAVTLAAGCKDACEELTSQVEIAFTLGSVSEAKIHKLEAFIRVNSGKLRKSDLSKEAAGLAAGAASGRFSIDFASEPFSSGDNLWVELKALGAGDKELATGEPNMNPVSVQPNGCNFITVKLGVPGDGGVDALADSRPDARDAGPDSGPDASADTSTKPDLRQDGPIKVDLTKDGPVKVDLTKDGPVKVDLTKDGPTKPDLTPDGPTKPDLTPDGPTKPDLTPDGPSKPDLTITSPTGWCTKDKWCSLNPLPTARALRGAWSTGQGGLFLVGDEGLVMTHTGGKWASPASGTTASLNGVWGTSSTLVYAVGDKHKVTGGTMSTVLRFNGKSWTVVTNPETMNLTAVWGTSTTSIHAVGENGTILHSADGTTWKRQMLTGISKPSLRGVWGSGPSLVFAVGDYDAVNTRNTIFQFDGKTWSWMPSISSKVDLRAAHGCGPSDVYAVGKGGKVLHYDGKKWVALSSATTKDLHAVRCVSANLAIAAGAGGTIVHFNGTHWIPATSTSANHLYSLTGDAGGNSFVAGHRGTLAQFSAGKWKPLSSDVVQNELRDISGTKATGPLLIVGKYTWDSGFYLYPKKASGGAVKEWSLPTKSPVSPQQVFCADKSTCYVAGVLKGGGGSIPALAHWDSNQTKMTAAANIPSSGSWPGLEDVWADAYGEVFTGGNSVFVTNKGHGLNTWTSLSTKLCPYGIWATSTTNVFTVGHGIIRYDGTNCTSANPCTEMISGTTKVLYNVWGSSHSDVFAVGENGQILHYDGNAQDKWTPMAVSGLSTVTLRGVWGSGPSDVYAVGSGGTIIHYSCPPALPCSWVVQDSGTTVHLRGVWGTGVTDVFVVGENGTILHRGP